MQWINEQLIGEYVLSGDAIDGTVRLIIHFPGGEKILRVKHMTQSDLNDATVDDIRRHFSRIVDKIKAKSEDQLKLLCT